MPDEIAWIGVPAVGALFGAFLGFVVPAGSLLGAVVGAVALSLLAVVYLATEPDGVGPSDSPGH